MNNPRLRRTVSVAVLSAVTGLLLIPASHLPDLSGAGLFSFPHADKLVHAGLYAVVTAAAFFFAGAPARRRVQTLVFAILFAVAHGAGVEWLQPRVGRTSERGDFVADFAGTALFAIGYRRVTRPTSG